MSLGDYRLIKGKINPLTGDVLVKRVLSGWMTWEAAYELREKYEDDNGQENMQDVIIQGRK